MKSLKNFSAAIGSVAIIVAVLTLVAPKTAHAVVAALVTVTNTTANPASTLDADKATRIPYQSSTSVTPPTSGGQALNFSVAQVPTGYRLVIENINAFLLLESGTAIPFGTIYSTFNVDAQFPSFSGINTGAEIGVINQNVIRYIGPGDTPQVSITANFLALPSTVTVTGHLEDCSVVGCPAIVQ